MGKRRKEAKVGRELDRSVPRWNFNGKPVKAQVRTMVVDVLDYFNERAGTSFAAVNPSGVSENAKRITRAVIDHPDAPLESWRHLIDWTLANPWWSGPATVGAVFGPRVIEDNIERCRRQARTNPSGSRRVTTTESTLAMARARLVERGSL